MQGRKLTMAAHDDGVRGLADLRRRERVEAQKRAKAEAARPPASAPKATTDYPLSRAEALAQIMRAEDRSRLLAPDGRPARAAAYGTVTFERAQSAAGNLAREAPADAIARAVDEADKAYLDRCKTEGITALPEIAGRYAARHAAGEGKAT